MLLCHSASPFFELTSLETCHLKQKYLFFFQKEAIGFSRAYQQSFFGALFNASANHNVAWCQGELFLEKNI